MGLNEKGFKFLRQELQEEKGLISPLKKLLNLNTYSIKFVFINLILLSLLLAISYLICIQGKFLNTFSVLIDYSLTLGIGIIGFLIAGFSIYMASIDKNFMYVLILQRYQGKQISYYKYTLLSYAEPFALFGFIILSCITLRFLLPLEYLITPETFRLFIKVFTLAYIMYLNIISLYSLAIFIKNLYSTQCAIATNQVLERYILSNNKKYDLILDDLENKINNLSNK